MERPARDRKNGMTQSNGTLSLNDLIASRREGHSMPQEFYTDAAVHLADVEQIFRRWLILGSCWRRPS